MKCIKYKKGYKYQLVETYCIKIDLFPTKPIDIDFVKLDTDGTLTLKKGYAWDGATGVPDVPSIRRGAVIHDSLYQLIIEGQLDAATYKDKADRILQQMCIEDGMSKFRAYWIYWGVHTFGKPGAYTQNKPTLAPDGCEE